VKKSYMKATVAVSAALVLTLSACGRGEDSGSGGKGGSGNLDIALVSKGFQHQFWQAVKAGAEEKAKELGVSMTFDGPASETEVDAQLQMLQSAIERQPDAIGYAALDPEACVPLLDQAKQAVHHRLCGEGREGRQAGQDPGHGVVLVRQEQRRLRRHQADAVPVSLGS
jgi:ribose transport system substrate-binding protein